MKKLNLSLITLITSIVIIAVCGIIIFASIAGIGNTYADKRAEEIKDSIISCVAQCYAIEGKYPSDIKYLEDHYGLQLDTKDYTYHYEIFASNIFPDIRVFAKG
jgi:hypothetical protein